MCVRMYVPFFIFNRKSLFVTEQWWRRGATVACRSCDLILAFLGVNDHCFQTLPSRPEVPAPLSSNDFKRSVCWFGRWIIGWWKNNFSHSRGAPSVTSLGEGETGLLVWPQLFTSLFSWPVGLKLKEKKRVGLLWKESLLTTVVFPVVNRRCVSHSLQGAASCFRASVLLPF